MTTLDTRLEEIKQRLEAARIMDTEFAISEGAPTETKNMVLAIRTAAFPLVQAAPTDIALLLKLVEVYREALVTIECGLVTSESTAKFAGLRPKQIAHSALTKAEAIARGR